MPKIVPPSEVAAAAGITVGQLARLSRAAAVDGECLPGEFYTTGGQRRYYDGAALRNWIKLRIDGKRASQERTARKYRRRPRYLRPSEDQTHHAIVSAYGERNCFTSAVGLPEQTPQSQFDRLLPVFAENSRGHWEQSSRDRQNEPANVRGPRPVDLESVFDWGWADFARRIPQRAKRLGLGVATFAKVNGHDMRRLQERARVGRMFRFSARHAALTFRHHAEALGLCGNDVKQASTWLDKAERESWSVAQMCSEIRRSRAPQSTRDDSIDRSEIEISNLELASARRLRLAKTFDADEARRELEAIRNTVALVDALRARCGTAS